MKTKKSQPKLGGKFKDKEELVTELMDTFKGPVLICLRNGWKKDFYMFVAEAMWDACPHNEGKNEN